MARKSILVVDDEKNQREILETILSGEGYDVTTASSGEAAMKFVESRRFDLVLTDLKMAGMSGLDLLKELTNFDKSIIVILLTAHGSVDSAVDALRLGAFDYLQKPYDSEKLLDLMRRVPIDPPAEPANAQRGIVVNTATPELLDAAIRLLRLLDRPADIAAMAPLIEQEILYRILTGPAGGQLMNIIAAGSHGNRIARAIAWLRENFARQLRIEDLADHIGMSVSSFHHHFKTITAMTPVQYQKQLRLHEARRLMLLERLDAGTAGHRVGYQSPSQFSREYSRFYGLSPSRDIDASREISAAG